MSATGYSSFPTDDFKVLITTSGIGSRLGEFTRYTNKSLVAIGDQPAITKIIESYPVGTRFVITLGHYGDLIRQYLSLAHPDESFEFVEVDNFDQPGSSLAYSMLQAKKFLACPFIFHASDTLVGTQDIPSPNQNWIAGYKGDDATQYTSFDGINGHLLQTHSKGMDRYDYIHIGLIGVKEYDNFWNSLEELHSATPMDTSLNDLRAVALMVEKKASFKIIEFQKWLDVGSIKGLIQARSESNHELDTLEKIDEAIFRVGNRIIKYFANEQYCSSRVARATILQPSVPRILGTTNNYYAYEFVSGEVLSKCLNSKIFEGLLSWALQNFWSDQRNRMDDSLFNSTCLEFYLTKTRKRIEEFLSKSGYSDSEQIINGKSVPKLETMLQSLEESQYLVGKQGKVHGDFILDNLVKTKSGFIALDWRQDFGGLLDVGDIYYDLAKLNHSLTMNHQILNQNDFRLNIDGDITTIDILRYDSFVECSKSLRQFVELQGLDFQKVEVLTGIIWINMSALHPHPLDIFLFNYGKYQLWNSLQKLSQVNFE